MHEKSILVVDTPKQVENGAFSCVGGALDDGREVGMAVSIYSSSWKILLDFPKKVMISPVLSASSVRQLTNSLTSPPLQTIKSITAKMT